MYIKKIKDISKQLSPFINNTPLLINERLSEQFNTNIYFKYENLQVTRSFKIRGSLNKILKNKTSNMVTASAGNHAQGVAYASNLLKIHSDIYIPNNTPNQKINRIKYFGKDNITIHNYGETFSECLDMAIKSTGKNLFIHPYDDIDIIDGQATICKEIYDEINPDIIICPVGGGGLISGISKYSKMVNKSCKIYSVEPSGANSLQKSIKYNDRINLKNIDNFVDGASVSQIGKINFDICRDYIDKTFSASNGKICHNLIQLYENEGIILEPAGTLSTCIFEQIKNEIIGKNIVCILSGGNNDLTRYNKMVELDLEYQNLKHKFDIHFIQKPGQLKKFINTIINKNDDISYFKYNKKTNEKYGIVTIELETYNINDFINNLKKYNYNFTKY